MRELKFRAWSNRFNKWIYDCEIGFCVRNGVSVPYWNSDNVTVEQYTGLKDKNGNEIYEGDIVKYAWTRCNYIVAYRKYDASFVLENDDREEIIFFHYDRQSDYEVLGTIHENPELLEEGK